MGNWDESQQFDSLSVSAPIAAQVGSLARSDTYAAKLNAGGVAPQPLGPLAQRAVQKGDTVTAYGLYRQAVKHNLFFSLASFLAGVLPPAAPAPAPAGPERPRGRGGLPLLQVGLAAGLTQLPQLRGGVPKGYLRVLVFNADSVLVSQQVQPLSKAALNNYEPLRLQVLVPTDGYVTAYVGNESDVDVYFDDITVEVRQGLQVQEAHYDPAGLELAGLGGTTPGLKRLSQYRWNGKEFQADLGLNWTQLDWRLYDPQLNDTHVVDPEVENGQESWSPYALNFDNAVRYNDPDGRCPVCPVLLPLLPELAAAIAPVVEAVLGMGAGVAAGELITRGGLGNTGSLGTMGLIPLPNQADYPSTRGNAPTTSARDGNGRVNAAPASTRREQGPNDKTMPSERAARREAFRENKVPTSKANNFKREKDPDKNPNLRGPKGEPAEKIKTQDGNGNPVTIDHHKNGHEFKDNNTHEQPHYHGPNGKGHLSY